MADPTPDKLRSPAQGMRDAKVDTRPGDVFRKGNATVTIILFGKGEFQFNYSGDGSNMPPMARWDQDNRPLFSEWAKNAEVIHAAE